MGSGEGKGAVTVLSALLEQVLERRSKSNYLFKIKEHKRCRECKREGEGRRKREWIY